MGEEKREEEERWWLAFNELRKTPWLIHVSNPFTSGAVWVVLTLDGFCPMGAPHGPLGKVLELNFSRCHQRWQKVVPRNTNKITSGNQERHLDSAGPFLQSCGETTAKLLQSKLTSLEMKWPSSSVRVLICRPVPSVFIIQLSRAIPVLRPDQNSPSSKVLTRSLTDVLPAEESIGQPLQSLCSNSGLLSFHPFNGLPSCK